MTSAAAGAPSSRESSGFLVQRLLPHIVFFFSCTCIMVVELVASRLIARHLGSSLYTWSAVIGVMLAGITAGNVAGGRLADRRRPGAVLPWLFLGAAVACCAALGLNALFAAARPLSAFSWPLQILLSVVAIFILPAFAIGTLSPSLAKMAIARGRGVGSTLGVFYACGTAGSLAGTFLTGYWLLFVMGNTAVVLSTSALLVVLGAIVRLTRGPADEGHASEQGLAAGGRAAQASAVEVIMWRGGPQAIAFFAAVCLMIVELLASRIIAEQAGSSLYTWTSVIGIVLAGMSLGNYAGGALSDRFRPTRLIGWLFLAASISCAAILPLAYAISVSDPFAGWHWPARVFSMVASIFFVPSVVLGTFQPAVTKVAVQQARARVGGAVGGVSAWNAAGSIVGTIASGFWLISALGSRSLTMLVAGLLALAGVALGPRRLVHGAWALVVLAALVVTRVDVPPVSGWHHAGMFRPDPSDLFDADSAYQHIRVYEEASDKEPDRSLRVLALDYLIHGYVDLSEPGYLNYDYERIYRDVAVRYGGARTRVSAFFLGGGSYTFPRWLRTQWPGSTAVVAEIDPMVLEANHRVLGLPRDTPIRTLVGDARNAVDDLPASARFDFFFGDAFNDLSVPYHLTTLEFARKVSNHLAPGGAYLVNVIDSYRSGLLLGSFINTLRQVFPHVYVFCTETNGVGERRDTFVVAASHAPLDITGWGPHHEGDFGGSLLTDANIVELLKKCRGRILTDDSAPVENLLAPVVRERTGEDREN